MEKPDPQVDELFRIDVEKDVSATPEQVYAVVSDLPRSGEWSAECRGGEWIAGPPGAAGSVFRGRNVRSPETVAWAPVVRGEWSTEAEVVDAVPGRRFAWAMRDGSGRAQESVWAFEISGHGTGSMLAHRCRMGSPTEGICGITAEMDATERARFIEEWSAKLATEMAETVARIRALIEEGK